MLKIDGIFISLIQIRDDQFQLELCDNLIG